MTPRLEKLYAAMQASGLDAVALNPGPTLTYLTDLSFHLMERPVVMFFAPGKEPALVLPELVVVVETLKLPLEPPPKNPPKKPPNPPPQPPEPPITIGCPPPAATTGACGSGGSGIGIGTMANSSCGGITRCATGVGVGVGRGGMTRRAGRSLIDRTGCALTDL